MQLDVAQAKAASLDMKVAAIFRETASASGKRSWQRSELQSALQMAQTGGHALVVARIDRLSRNLADLPKLLAFGVPIYSADRVRRLSERALRAGIKEGEIESLRKGEMRRLRAAVDRIHGRRRRGIDPTAATRGRLRNQLRRDDNIRTAASVLVLDPEWRMRTHRARAEQLRTAGVLRYMQVNREVGRSELWTRDAIKTNWGRLRNEIERILTPLRPA